MRRPELPEERDLAADHRREVVALDDLAPRRLAEAPRELTVVNQPLDGPRNPGDVPWIDQEPGAPVVDGGPVATDIGRDARDAAAHRLQQDLRVTFGERGQDENVRGRVDGREPPVLDPRGDLEGPAGARRLAGE